MTDGGRAALQLAAELGGTRLSGAGGALVLVERVRAHGLAAVAVLAREPAQLAAPLAAWEDSDAPVNLAALLPLPETDLPGALAFHRRRIGALSAALDASLPWLAGRPMLAKRLPGRLALEADLPAAPLGPLERAELRAFLADAGGWDDAAFEATFLRPRTLLWPDVEAPAGAEVRVPPLRLAVGSPLLDALRASLRAALRLPIPLLPLPEDPSGLHALKALTPEVAAFRGPEAAWAQAFRALSALPAPPHFCARC